MFDLYPLFISILAEAAFAEAWPTTSGNSSVKATISSLNVSSVASCSYYTSAADRPWIVSSNGRFCARSSLSTAFTAAFGPPDSASRSHFSPTAFSNATSMSSFLGNSPSSQPFKPFSVLTTLRNSSGSPSSSGGVQVSAPFPTPNNASTNSSFSNDTAPINDIWAPWTISKTFTDTVPATGSGQY
jgi:hypothetical protein